MELYQDIWKHGEVIPGIRECASRYEAIKKELLKFNRPFTVLDIGANLGYFSFRIANDFPNATCVMIENAYGSKLTELAVENDLKNVIVLNTKVSSKELINLSKCEHFDIVLALNIIHHIGDVDSCLSAIENLGDTIIIETPNPNDKGSCGKHRLENIFNRVNTAYELIGSFSRHTSKNAKSIMGVLKTTKTKLEKKYWDSDKKGDRGIFNISIESNNHNKVYFNDRIDLQEKRDWVPGINFRTFTYLNGSYPRSENIISMLKNLDIKNHSDVVPWNIIISGNKLTLIDFQDSRQGDIISSNQNIEKIINELLSNKITTIADYVKKI